MSRAKKGQPFSKDQELSLARAYDLLTAAKGPLELESVAPFRAPWTRALDSFNASRIEKALGRNRIRALSEIEAEESGAFVTDTFAQHGYYESASGIKEKTDITFKGLAGFAHEVEPVAAIINTRVGQVANYVHIPKKRTGIAREPAFRIRMTLPEEEARQADRRAMSELEHFVMEGGWCAPPKDEMPVGWQPGFDHFIRCIVRDSLTYDWMAVQLFAPTDQSKSQMREDWPVVCFAAVDASLIRNPERPVNELRNGVIVRRDYEGERPRTKNGLPITKLKVDSTSRGGRVVAEYTDQELVTGVRVPRTSERTNGYGYGELERGLNACNGWIYSRDYNLSRFRMDSLPRGILSLPGSIDTKQFNSFRNEWYALLRGFARRWNVPVVRGIPGSNEKPQWIDIDRSSREMEYFQLMFSLALWLHSLYGIHPEETGYQALSPFRPPLSEGTPVVKIEHSQDSGLVPLMRFLENFINRYIIWRIYPDRRYSFEWVGLKEVDLLQDIQMRAARLQAGLSTPRMEWAEMDQPLPEGSEDMPAWDIPAPFMEGMAFAMQQEQQEEQSAMMAQEQSQASQAALTQPPQVSAPPAAAGGEGTKLGNVPGQGTPMPSPATPTSPVGVISSKSISANDWYEAMRLRGIDKIRRANSANLGNVTQIKKES